MCCRKYSDPVEEYTKNVQELVKVKIQHRTRCVLVTKTNCSEAEGMRVMKIRNMKGAESTDDGKTGEPKRRGRTKNEDIEAVKEWKWRAGRPAFTESCE